VGFGSRHACADTIAALIERFQSPLNQSQVAAVTKPRPACLLSAIAKNAGWNAEVGICLKHGQVQE